MLPGPANTSGMCGHWSLIPLPGFSPLGLNSTRSESPDREGVPLHRNEKRHAEDSMGIFLPLFKEIINVVKKSVKMPTIIIFKVIYDKRILHRKGNNQDHVMCALKNAAFNMRAVCQTAIIQATCTESGMGLNIKTEGGR